ncbi:MAG: hypothetical protein HFJ54_07630 [Clostridia bacterium]|nr:hypothetical protein [Clostridia bacterium]
MEKSKNYKTRIKKLHLKLYLIILHQDLLCDNIKIRLYKEGKKYEKRAKEKW